MGARVESFLEGLLELVVVLGILEGVAGEVPSDVGLEECRGVVLGFWGGWEGY